MGTKGIIRKAGEEIAGAMLMFIMFMVALPAEFPGRTTGEYAALALLCLVSMGVVVGIGGGICWCVARVVRAAFLLARRAVR